MHVGVAGPDAVDPVAVADVGGETPAHVGIDDEVLELGRQPVMPGHRPAVEMVGDAAPQHRLTDRVDGADPARERPRRPASAA